MAGTVIFVQVCQGTRRLQLASHEVSDAGGLRV